MQRGSRIMSIFERAIRFSPRRWSKDSWLLLLPLVLLLAAGPQKLLAHQDPPVPPAPQPQAQVQDHQPPDQQSSDQQAAEPGAPASTYAQQSPEQLQRLVAPIALYPDSLVAQILAASTFPQQAVEADRWVQAHPDLKGDALGQAVDQQPWDPSVKALAAFPSVLGNMDKNLSWTSSLGDAYYNQQQDVMDAVQVMRRRAQDAGNLKSTQQQTVQTQESSIVIQPADPEIVYVPAYDPWVVYGGPLVAWPGWYPYPGIWFGGPYLSWGGGFGIGWFGGFGWGWPNWGFDWHNHYAIYNRGRYYSRSNTFYNRGNFYRGRELGAGSRAYAGSRPGNGNVGARGGVYGRPGGSARPFGNANAARGYAEPRGQSGVRSGAFSGYDHGGQARGFSSRGSSSMGGARGGGGGFHGGGGHGGRR
jgi:uncharacterized membrane protein YgcG